jgi:single-strand DNA-binding protein
MANLNKVLLIGRLTRDPESRATKGGTTVVSFGLAVNRTYTRGESNERVEETCFLDCEAWGRQGETIARYMKKGRQIFLEGRLKLDSWEKDGQKHNKIRVVVENFQFIDSQSGSDQKGGGGGGAEGEGGSGGARRGRDEGARPAAHSAPVPATTPGETPQDDYPAQDDDIPF